MKKLLSILFLLLINNILKIKTRETKELPKYLKIGYTFFGECDEKIFEAVQNGVNIIIWSQIDFSSNEDNSSPIFKGDLDYTCVAKMNQRFVENNLNIINLLSVGGSGCPHINTDFTANEYLDEWIKFNQKISSTENHFFGFDGIDWDIEGNEDLESNNNYFTYKELEIIGKLSQLLKKERYIVSITPKESYLDPTTSEFSLSLINNSSEWGNEFTDCLMQAFLLQQDTPRNSPLTFYRQFQESS